MFNYNYAQAKAVTSNYKDSEEVRHDILLLGAIGQSETVSWCIMRQSYRAKCDRLVGQETVVEQNLPSEEISYTEQKVTGSNVTNVSQNQMCQKNVDVEFLRDKMS